MHGRPRKALKPEEEVASAAKAEKLRSLQSQLMYNHHNKIYTEEAIELSTKLLEINPEAYTAWNYRKLAVENKLGQTESDSSLLKSILDEELRVVESALRQNFKSYGAWHHRKWVLSKGNSSIGNELSLLDKFQRLDSRNFHAWNYRRFVAELMGRSEQDELRHTEDMINNNFSNYSAWHNRSVLLSRLLSKNVQGFLLNEKIPEELGFVHQAIFTDPDDQSGWFYHLWLLDQTFNPGSPLLTSSWPAHGSNISLSGAACLDGTSHFTSLCSDSGTFPLVLYFNQAVGGVSSCNVTVESELKGNGDLVWRPLSLTNSQFSCVWVAHMKYSISEPCISKEYKMKVSLGNGSGIVSSNGRSLSVPYEFIFTVHTRSAEVGPTEGPPVDTVSWMDDFHIWDARSKDLSSFVSSDQLNTKNDDDTKDFEWRLAAIVQEIECFRELLSLADSKIGKLTLARLLTAHEAMISDSADKLVHSEEIIQLYKDLMKLDTSHYQCYKDEHSVTVFRLVTSNGESLSRHLFHFRDWKNVVCLRLNNLSLSRIGCVEKLLFVQMLDLSHNELRSTEGLEAMQLLCCLNLSHNRFSSFSALASVRHLKQLKVLDVSHNQIGGHSVDTTRYLCASPFSHSVESEWVQDEAVSDRDSLTKYWDVFFVLRELNLQQLDVKGNAIAGDRFRSFVIKVVPKLLWLDGQRVSE